MVVYIIVNSLGKATGIRVHFQHYLRGIEDDH